MTDKICLKCGTWTPTGRYCPECGQQLYPDVGQTKWVDMFLGSVSLKTCKKPKFNIWTGEKRSKEQLKGEKPALGITRLQAFKREMS